jgi:MoaA/NifB/PqqE/SkfB family radical SAM enzyme
MPWRPLGLCDVEAPTVSRQSAHRRRWGCQPYTPAALYPPGRFLVLISVRGWVDPRAIVRLEGLGQLKKKHLIGIRTRVRPACRLTYLKIRVSVRQGRMVCFVCCKKHTCEKGSRWTPTPPANRSIFYHCLLGLWSYLVHNYAEHLIICLS